MYSKAKEKGILRGRSSQLLWQLLFIAWSAPTLEDIVTLRNVIRKFISKHEI
ncbi:MAG: hypothetical protein WA364_20210 [Candidatus Nitrosopolaris sp.]